MAARPGPPSQRSLAPRVSPKLALCFPALGVLCGQVLVRGRQILTAQPGSIQQLKEFPYVAEQPRWKCRSAMLPSRDFERRQRGSRG